MGRPTMSYVHPLAGALAIALLLWVGSQGLRSRHKARYAQAARRHHARFAPLALWACLAVAVAGPVSVVLTREDLELVDSWHFWFGWIVALLMTTAWFTSRRLHQDPRLKRLHPFFGITAMLLSIFGAMLGFGMLP